MNYLGSMPKWLGIDILCALPECDKGRAFHQKQIISPSAVIVIATILEEGSWSPASLNALCDRCPCDVRSLTDVRAIPAIQEGVWATSESRNVLPSGMLLIGKGRSSHRASLGIFVCLFLSCLSWCSVIATMESIDLAAVPFPVDTNGTGLLVGRSHVQCTSASLLRCTDIGHLTLAASWALSITWGIILLQLFSYLQGRKRDQ